MPKNKPSLISVPQMFVKVSFFLVHVLFWYNFDSGDLIFQRQLILELAKILSSDGIPSNISKNGKVGMFIKVSH